MKGRIAVASVGIATLLLLAQTFEVQLDIRPKQAIAKANDAFWKQGPSGAATGRPDTFADLAENLSPAVVNIQTERAAESGGEDLFEEFFGRRSPKPRRRPRFRSESTGSGFVISADGYIITNNHVVEDAQKIIAVFEDGNELEASVIGLDAKTDLALLKVEPKGKLDAAPLGNSDEVRVGDWVMAIGNPFGLDHSVTVGILSAKGRNINAGPYDDFLQTDASINPGNSGGPLIDMRGRVVGINTAINAAGQGIGFAIPINMAKELLPQLREMGSVTRGWLGVQIQRVTPALADTFGLKTPRGALISQVFDDSPASRAKLKHGDVIIEFNGGDINNYDDLPRRVAATPPGSEVDVIVVRDGKEKKLKATLEKMEQTEKVSFTKEQPHSSDWGFSAQDLNAQLAERLGLPEGASGVVIQEVDPEGLANRAGLRPGDIILEVNKEKIDNLEDLEDTLDEDDESVVLLIQRGESTLYVAIEAE